MEDSEGAVRKMESSFRMRDFGFSAFLTCILPRIKRNAILLMKVERQMKEIRLPIINVTHVVKIMDSCSRENAVLCTVARPWLLFLHDESEWKKYESNIAPGVVELHRTF